MAVDVHIPIALSGDSADYITQYGSGTATVYLEYGTATTPADGTATTLVVSGTEQYEFWVPGETDYYYRWRIGDGSTYTDYSPVFQAPTGYCTLQEVKRGRDFPDASRDDELQAMIVEATAFITEKVCGGRSFFRDPVGSGDKTLTLDVEYSGQSKLSLARGKDLDIISITTMTVADYTGDTGTTVASGATGYYLMPDYPRTGEPYTDLVLSDQGTNFVTYPTGYRVVSLTGAFGWASVPDAVRRATVDLVRWWWDDRGRQGEPVGISALGQPIFAGYPKTVRDLHMSRYAWKDYIG